MKNLADLIKLHAYVEHLSQRLDGNFRREALSSAKVNDIPVEVIGIYAKNYIRICWHDFSMRN